MRGLYVGVLANGRMRAGAPALRRYPVALRWHIDGVDSNPALRHSFASFLLNVGRSLYKV